MPSGRPWSSGSRSASIAGWSGSRGARFNAYRWSGPRPSAALRRTTSSGPGSRASPSGSCAGGPIEVIALPVASHDWFRHDQDLLPVMLEASDVSRRSDTQSRVEHRNDCGVSGWVRDRGAQTITLPFLLDTGASDLVIPADVALTLIRAGALTSGDFIGKSRYRLANGSEE